MSGEGKPTRESIKKPSIEATANFEGNETLLLLKRVSDPVIEDQIVNLLYKSGVAYAERLKNEHFTPWGKPEQNLVQDSEGMVMSLASLSEPSPTLEQIRTELKERMLDAGQLTRVTLDENKQPSEQFMSPFYRLPGQSERMTTKQLSIVEAHEKGHVLRPYGGKFLNNYFQRGFDQSKVEYTELDFESDKRNPDRDPEEVLTYDLGREEMLSYLFSSAELAERMGQMKNYFGMSGHEIFTKEHLAYARTHYIPDTGLDNRMTPFFAAITPETESAFLEILNSGGI